MPLKAEFVNESHKAKSTTLRAMPGAAIGLVQQELLGFRRGNVDDQPLASRFFRMTSNPYYLRCPSICCRVMLQIMLQNTLEQCGVAMVPILLRVLDIVSNHVTNTFLAARCMKKIAAEFEGDNLR